MYAPQAVVRDPARDDRCVGEGTATRFGEATVDLSENRTIIPDRMILTRMQLLPTTAPTDDSADGLARVRRGDADG